MISLEEYATYCAPRALAAITGMAPIQAAWVLQTVEPDTGPAVPNGLLVAALRGCGYDVETFVENFPPTRELEVRALAQSKGTWLVFTGLGDEGHVLVLQDGRAIAGDPEGRYQRALLLAAWEVTAKPKPAPPPPPRPARRRPKVELVTRRCQRHGPYVVPPSIPMDYRPCCEYRAARRHQVLETSRTSKTLKRRKS
jgi:hypothetical protein